MALYGNQLFDLVAKGRADDVKNFMERNPKVDVNWKGTDHNDQTALHLACFMGQCEIVSMLLDHGGINVNIFDRVWTPFHVACVHNKVEVVKLLLRDGRVLVNVTDEYGCTPLWYAAHFGHIECLKWVIASGRDIKEGLEKKGKFHGESKKYTAIEIAKAGHKKEVVLLLERFMADPVTTRHSVRVSLGLVDTEAAEMFATIVFLCDDYLVISKKSKRDDKGDADSKARSFFYITQSLPMEIQEKIVNISAGQDKQFVKNADSEKAFRAIGRVLGMTKPGETIHTSVEKGD